jgi:hypothetical protein
LVNKKEAGGCDAGPFEANLEKQHAPSSAFASQSQPSFALRPYQADVVERVRGAYRSGLAPHVAAVVAPLVFGGRS